MLRFSHFIGFIMTLAAVAMAQPYCLGPYCSPDNGPELFCFQTGGAVGFNFRITDIAGTHTSVLTELFDDRVLAQYLYVRRQDGPEKDEVDYRGSGFSLDVYVDWTERSFPASFSGFVGSDQLRHVPFTCHYLDPLAHPPHDPNH